MFDQMEIPATVDRRIAANLLQLLAPRTQEAQALLEAVQVLQRIAGAPEQGPPSMGVRRALSPEGGE